jgi:transposase
MSPARIETLIEPCLHQVAQLDAVPGIGVICAQDIIAGTGVDMTVFPTASHLVSQVKQPAGKRKGSNPAGRGNPCLSAAVGEAAISTGRTQSFPGARYRRLAKRMPKKKALAAVGNSMLTRLSQFCARPCYVGSGGWCPLPPLVGQARPMNPIADGSPRPPTSYRS